MHQNYRKHEVITLTKEIENQNKLNPTLAHFIILLNNQTIQAFLGIKDTAIIQTIDNHEKLTLHINFDFVNAEKMEQFNQKDIHLITSIVEHLNNNKVDIISSNITHILGELQQNIHSLSLDYIMNKDMENVKNINPNTIKKF